MFRVRVMVGESYPLIVDIAKSRNVFQQTQYLYRLKEKTNFMEYSFYSHSYFKKNSWYRYLAQIKHVCVVRKKKNAWFAISFLKALKAETILFRMLSVQSIKPRIRFDQAMTSKYQS